LLLDLAHRNKEKNLGQAKGQAKGLTESQLLSNQCLGADTLVQLLKNYARSLDIKSKISVGIIGFPNVGKSSVINSLKRSKAVGVGARAGFTKNVSEVVLDSNITLIDCPGIIFSSEMSESEAALRNCVNFDQLDDYVLPVQALLDRCNHDTLVQIYKIPMFKDTPEFIRSVAQRRGKIGKGGIPSEEAGARLILKDWNTGRIPYYTVPPGLEEQALTRALNAKIVSDWSEQFQLREVMELERTTVLDKLKDLSLGKNDSLLFAKPAKSTTLRPDDMFMDLGREDEPEEAQDVTMMDTNAQPQQQDKMKSESEETEGDSVNKEKIIPKTLIASIKEKKEPPAKKRKVARDIEDLQRNAALKKEFQLDKKEVKKMEKEANENNMDVPLQDTKYDFGVDFWKSPIVPPTPNVLTTQQSPK